MFSLYVWYRFTVEIKSIRDLGCCSLLKRVEVLVLCIYVAITSIGLMNLLIGVMITTAIENAKRDDKYHRSKEIAERFILMRRLRGLLEPELEQLYYDPRNEDDRTEFMNRISERHIIQWRRRWPYKYYFDMAQLSMRDVAEGPRVQRRLLELCFPATNILTSVN